MAITRPIELGVYAKLARTSKRRVLAQIKSGELLSKQCDKIRYIEVDSKLADALFKNAPRPRYLSLSPQTVANLGGVMLFGLLLTAFLMVSGWVDDQYQELELERSECVQRGVAYFEEIGSFPFLKSEPDAGRHAVDVARERCEHTTTTF